MMDQLRLLPAATSIRYPAKTVRRIPLPLFVGKVAAGFPSPADDSIEKTLDLNELLVQKPAATFFVRAQGQSMLGAGIHPNDILVVDRSIEPVPGKIVICALNSELTVKRLDRDNGQWQLKAENPNYPDIAIYDELELVIWGVVTTVIHPL
jgi:DNA polymerase V